MTGTAVRGRRGAEPVQTVRCAIYTRKSTDEGLDQEFNSLDAQRESAEAFILSQRGEGWQALPDRYDDGGFSGGTLERPALRRLYGISPKFVRRLMTAGMPAAHGQSAPRPLPSKPTVTHEQPGDAGERTRPAGGAAVRAPGRACLAGPVSRPVASIGRRR